jgi:hypothetical protein
MLVIGPIAGWIAEKVTRTIIGAILLLFMASGASSASNYLIDVAGGE